MLPPTSVGRAVERGQPLCPRLPRLLWVPRAKPDCCKGVKGLGKSCSPAKWRRAVALLRAADLQNSGCSPTNRWCRDLCFLHWNALKLHSCIEMHWTEMQPCVYIEKTETPIFACALIGVIRNCSLSEVWNGPNPTAREWKWPKSWLFRGFWNKTLATRISFWIDPAVCGPNIWSILSRNHQLLSIAEQAVIWKSLIVDFFQLLLVNGNWHANK